jgi:TetR/AcrR family transcriptional repressor of nem operon
MKALTELIWTGSYGSTTIDQICERAGVKKGSFYYFFDSKADLAEQAIQADWDQYRAKLDKIFSPSQPPMERLRRYCKAEYEEQLELKKQYGYTLGCPLCTLGASLRQKVNEVMDQGRKYFETAIRDAQAEGLIAETDARAKARAVYAYVEGLLSQARIQDDVEVLKEMEPGIMDILGARAPQGATEATSAA